MVLTGSITRLVTLLNQEYGHAVGVSAARTKRCSARASSSRRTAAATWARWAR